MRCANLWNTAEAMCISQAYSRQDRQGGKTQHSWNEIAISSQLLATLVSWRPWRNIRRFQSRSGHLRDDPLFLAMRVLDLIRQIGKARHRNGQRRDDHY